MATEAIARLHKRRGEGQAPLRGLCELRPLKVCRQTPNLFPGVAISGPIRPAADEPQTRQPKGRRSRGGTGRAEETRDSPRRSYGTCATCAGGAGPEKPQPRPPASEGLSWAVRSLRGCGGRPPLCTPESQVDKVLLQVFVCIIPNILAR